MGGGMEGDGWVEGWMGGVMEGDGWVEGWRVMDGWRDGG